MKTRPTESQPTAATHNAEQPLPTAGGVYSYDPGTRTMTQTEGHAEAPKAADRAQSQTETTGGES